MLKRLESGANFFKSRQSAIFCEAKRSRKDCSLLTDFVRHETNHSFTCLRRLSSRNGTKAKANSKRAKVVSGCGCEVE